jgi:hypothetical protein
LIFGAPKALIVDIVEMIEMIGIVIPKEMLRLLRACISKNFQQQNF